MATFTGSDKAISFLFDMVSNIASDYDNTSTYSVGDYAIHEGILYKCASAVLLPEDFDSTKWQAVLVMDEIGSGGGGGGTTVIANPAGAATDTLNKLQVASTIYDIPSGGGSGGTGVTAYSLSDILDSWGNDYGEIQFDHLRQFRENATALVIIGNVCFLRLAWTNKTVHSANQATIMTLKQDISSLLFSSDDFLRSTSNGSFLYANKYSPQNANDSWTLWTQQSIAHRVWIYNNNGKLTLREEGGTSTAYSVYEISMMFTLPVSSVGLAHEYSTEEHIVGKWVDGSTIYETTFDLGANTTISNTGWTTTTIQIPNLGGIISGMILTETLGTSTPVMTTFDAAKYIQLQSLRNSYTSTARYVVLQYTKAA